VVRFRIVVFVPLSTLNPVQGVVGPPAASSARRPATARYSGQDLAAGRNRVEGWMKSGQPDHFVCRSPVLPLDVAGIVAAFAVSAVDTVAGVGKVIKPSPSGAGSTKSCPGC
jgi:hypothetical protein